MKTYRGAIYRSLPGAPQGGAKTQGGLIYRSLDFAGLGGPPEGEARLYLDEAMTIPISMFGEMSCPDEGIMSCYSGGTNVRRLFAASTMGALKNVRISTLGSSPKAVLEVALDCDGDPGEWGDTIILDLPEYGSVPFYRRVTSIADQEEYSRDSLAYIASAGQLVFDSRFFFLKYIPPDASYEVLVGDQDISGHVMRLEVDGPSWEKAGSARLIVENRGGQFDPLVEEWTWSDTGELIEHRGSDLFRENSVVRICRWWGGNKVPVFYGLIARGATGYERGADEVLEVYAVDRSKNLLSRQVTTDVYENKQANAIIRDVFMTYGGLSSDDIDLASLDYVIPSVQFVDETVMDIARICLAPKGYRVYFDARGKLVSIPPPLPTGVPTAKYESRVRVVRSEWGDSDLPNRVIVYGKTLNLFEPVLEEQVLGTWSGTVGLWNEWATVTCWYSVDHKLKVKDPKIAGGQVVDGWTFLGPNVTWGLITQKTDYYCEVKIWNKEHIWNKGDFELTLKGRPLGTAVPGVIIAEASDEEAIELQGGDVIQEVEDLPIYDYDTAKGLSDTMIAEYKWLRKQVSGEVVSGIPSRGGDVVRLHNKRNGMSHDVFVISSGLRYERDARDIVEIRGGIKSSRPSLGFYVWTVGRNNFGQLGIGNRVDQNLYRRVQLDGVMQVAFGSMHGVALLADGTVWTWGSNEYGQLGLGDTTDRLLPVKVGSLEDIAWIAVGREFSFAENNDGIVWVWGNNQFGGLGLGDTTNRLSPTLNGSLTGAKAISGGAYHAIAIMGDGRVQTWGYNDEGALGDGTTVDKHSPQDVKGLPAGEVVQVVGSTRHCYARLKNGDVWAWGRNDEGMLCDGTFIDKPFPVKCQIADVKYLNCRVGHAAAIKSDGSLWCWGYNASGQCGDGKTQNLALPHRVSLPGQVRDVGTISRGHELGNPWGHTVAILDDKTVWAWGDNTYGQLGLGVTGGTYKEPQQVPGIADAVAILAFRHESTGLIRQSY